MMDYDGGAGGCCCGGCWVVMGRWRWYVSGGCRGGGCRGVVGGGLVVCLAGGGVGDLAPSLLPLLPLLRRSLCVSVRWQQQHLCWLLINFCAS